MSQNQPLLLQVASVRDFVTVVTRVINTLSQSQWSRAGVQLRQCLFAEVSVPTRELPHQSFHKLLPTPFWLHVSPPNYLTTFYLLLGCVHLEGGTLSLILLCAHKCLVPSDQKWILSSDAWWIKSRLERDLGLECKFPWDLIFDFTGKVIKSWDMAPMESFEPIVGWKGGKKCSYDFSYGFSQGSSYLLSHFPAMKSVSLKSPEAAWPVRMPLQVVLASSRGKAFPLGLRIRDNWLVGHGCPAPLQAPALSPWSSQGTLGGSFMIELQD